MGLMLSVLVFCVGVAEVLDCWHHFLLYLVQPQYNPLPYSLDPRKDVLCEQELSPSPDSRRPSHVDISWPKDLSPTDDLHVIKKRPHNENERIFDGVGDCCSPQVVVCGPGPEDPHCATGSWNTSPNHLELSVISESDSSSEIDEPSLIENLSYNKACCDTSSSAKDKLEKQLSHGQSTVMSSSNDLELETERGVPCSSPSALEHSTTISSYVEENGSVTVSSELPVFTDNILSSNVHKVSSRYSSDTSSYSPLCIDQTVSEEPANYDFNDYNTSTPLSNYERTSSENQSISSILDEGLDPIPEFPEIRLMESSPTPPEESSESSLNTSDASWMARGKTSDRPLIVRFYPSLEQIKKEFESVTKTDLQAFGNNTKHDDNESSVVQQEEVFKNNDVQEKVSKSEGYIDTFPQDFRQQQESKIPRSNILDDPEVNLDRVIDEKKCSLQHDTNSSSSSLSGIPQLPEDPKDTATRASLPTDNGYGSEYNGREENSRDISNTESNEDNEFSVTSDKSEPEQINLVDLGNVLEGTGESCQSFRSELQLVDTKTLNESINPQHSDNDLQQLKNNPPNSRSSIEGTHVEIVKENEVNTKDPNIYNISLQDPFKVPLEENNKYKNKGLNELKDAEISQDDTENDTDISESISKDSNLGSCVEEKHISHGKGKSTKNRRPKRSARDISKNNPGSETPVVLCQAKESDEEDHVDSHAQTSCVRSSPLLNEENICEREASSKLEPSTSSTSQKEAIPSTSKAETPENKAFWLIFSGEYTKAMNKDWHSGHFCCWQCDESLTGQRYVLRDEHPYCVKCYESIFANGCEECNKTIGIDSKDLSFKDKHWHEACFLCNKCRVSLVDKQFGSKLEKIFCGNCYDAQFASRCDSCGQIFKAGTKKMEYKTRQWHEPCFACCVCKSPIGTKSFIPREQEIYCAPCYEEKFATRCVKCNKIITSGGVTYKNEPWHRQCFTCTNCSTSLAGQRFTSREEKPYCGPCFGELFAKRCTACTKPITGIGGTRFISFEDRHWHNDCFICGSCQTSLVGRGFLTEGDDLICPECAKQKLM